MTDKKVMERSIGELSVPSRNAVWSRRALLLIGGIITITSFAFGNVSIGIIAAGATLAGGVATGSKFSYFKKRDVPLPNITSSNSTKRVPIYFEVPNRGLRPPIISEWEYRSGRAIPMLGPWSIDHYLRTKLNLNMLLFGRPRSGKTTFAHAALKESFSDRRKIVFSPKEGDRRLNLYLKYERIDMSKRLPNPFVSGHPEIFMSAFETAVNLYGEGITISSLRPVLSDIVKRSRDWDEFWANFQVKRKQMRTMIAAGVMETLESFIRSWFFAENMEYLSLSKEIDLFLDFSRIGGDEKSLFYMEVALEILGYEIKKRERQKTIIFIDEGWQLLEKKDPQGKTKSKVETMLKTISYTGSCVWISTQSYQDIPYISSDCCDTQIGFKTTNPDTLNAQPEIYGVAFRDLKDNEWIDLGQKVGGVDPSKEVFHFKLNLSEEQKRAAALEPELAEEEEEEAQYTPEGITLIVHDRLQSDVVVQSSLATELVKQYYPELTAKERKGEYKKKYDEIKKQIRNTLEKLPSNYAQSREFWFFYANDPTKPYFLNNAKDERLHEWFQKKIVRQLKFYGITQSEITVNQSREAKPDIECSKYNFVLECETGLRHRQFHDLDARVNAEGAKSSPRLVIILVPTDEDEYQVYFERYADKANVKVLAPYKLGEFLHEKYGTHLPPRGPKPKLTDEDREDPKEE